MRFVRTKSLPGSKTATAEIRRDDAIKKLDKLLAESRARESETKLLCVVKEVLRRMGMLGGEGRRL